MSGPATVLPLISGQVVQSAAVDNATATATVAATLAVRHIALGLHADYSAAPAAGFKTITLKKGSSTIVIFRHDFTQGAFVMPLPVGLGGDSNQAISAELQASGTAAVTGRVALFFISN